MSPLVVAALIIVHTFWFPLVCLATSRSQFVIFPFTLSFFIDSPSPVDCWSIKIVIYCTSFFAPWILYGYIMIHIYIHIQIIYILYIYINYPKFTKKCLILLLSLVSLGLAALRELQRFRRAPQTALPLLQSFKGFPWQAVILLKALRLHQAWWGWCGWCGWKMFVDFFAMRNIFWERNGCSWAFE